MWWAILPGAAAVLLAGASASRIGTASVYLAMFMETGTTEDEAKYRALAIVGVILMVVALLLAGWCGYLIGADR